MTEPRRELPESIRAGIWNQYMDGSSAAEIARYSDQLFHEAKLEYSECTPAEVKRVLSAEPPSVVANDLRYIHRVRAFWIAASDQTEGEQGAVKGFVVVFQPWKLTVQSFQRGVRAVCRDFRSLCPTGSINPYLLEGFEMDAALRLIQKNGTPAWIIDGDGGTTRYRGDFSQNEEHSPEQPQPPR